MKKLLTMCMLLTMVACGKGGDEAPAQQAAAPAPPETPALTCNAGQELNADGDACVFSAVTNICTQTSAASIPTGAALLNGDEFSTFEYVGTLPALSASGGTCSQLSTPYLFKFSVAIEEDPSDITSQQASGILYVNALNVSADSFEIKAGPSANDINVVFYNDSIEVGSAVFEADIEADGDLVLSTSTLSITLQ